MTDPFWSAKDWAESFEALNMMPLDDIPEAVRTRARSIVEASTEAGFELAEAFRHLGSASRLSKESKKTAEGIGLAIYAYKTKTAGFMDGHDECCCSHAIGLNEACRWFGDSPARREILIETQTWLIRGFGETGKGCEKGRAARYLREVARQLEEIDREAVNAEVLRLLREANPVATLESNDDGLLVEARQLAEQVAASNDPDVRRFSKKTRLFWREYRLARHLEALNYDVARVACFDVCLRNLKADNSSRARRPAMPLHLREAFIKMSLGVIDRGIRLDHRAAWLGRLADLRPHIADVTAQSRFDQAMIAYGQTASELEGDAGQLLAQLVHLAGMESLHAAIHLLGPLDLTPLLSASEALGVIRVVYENGSPHEKIRAARALGSLMHFRGAEVPGEIRTACLGWLDEVESRLFSIYAARAPGDRAMMLELADAFETGSGAPAIGALAEGNILDAMWKQAWFWRRRVLDLPFARSMVPMDYAPSDDLDRRALIGLAGQCRDGRGVAIAPEESQRLLELAAKGDTEISRRAALAFASDVKRRGAAAKVRRSRTEPKGIELEGSGDDRTMRAALEKAAIADTLAASFEFGKLEARPIVANVADDAASRPFWRLGQHKLPVGNPIARDDEAPARCYLEGVRSSTAPTRLTSPSAKALVMRYLLGLIPPDFVDGELIDQIYAAIARTPSRMALVAVASDPIGIRDALALRRLELPWAYGESLSVSGSRESVANRHAAWSSEALETFEALGGDYQKPAHLRFLQLHSELADLEVRPDAPLWNTIAVRASLRANGNTITRLSAHQRLTPKAAIVARARWIRRLVGNRAHGIADARLNRTEEIIDRSTRNVGVPINILTELGVPVAERHPKKIIRPHVYRTYRIDITADAIRLSRPDVKGRLDAVLTSEDAYVAAALAFLEGQAPSFSLESVNEFDERFVDPAILQHLAKKEWKPDWLGATPFGSTMYYADYLLSLAENGRDLFSIRHPFLSAELDPHWQPPNAWWTKNYVGGLSLTRSDRIALVASEITPVEFTRGRGRILCSFTIPHCNARVDGGGIEDTPTEKVRDVGAGDIRVRAARSAYFMTTRYPEMIRAFPIFGRGAYITALYAAFKQSGFNLSSAPRLEKRLHHLVDRYKKMRISQHESGDLDYVVLRGR